MSLPRLRCRLRNGRDIAAVLRQALLHQTAYVPLVEKPRIAGQHLLEIDIPGDEPITLLSDPAGPETAAGFPLAVRPVTRPQMAQLFSLIEKLDVPSIVDLPPASSSPGMEPRSDRTVMQPLTFDTSDVPSPISTAAGDSYVPPPVDELADSIAMIVLPLRRTPPPMNAVKAEKVITATREAVEAARDAARESARLGLGPVDDANADPSIVIGEEYDSSQPFGAELAEEEPWEPDDEPVSQITGVPEDPMIGRVLGKKYRLDALLGTGATAAVYKAWHIDLGRAVAVKVLHHQHADNTQFVQRFRGEARAASRLEHPNVARVTDFGHEEDGRLYLVMELLVGRSLEAVLAASGKLPPKNAVDLVIQAANGIAFAHDIGIIHRDVKPENLMLVGSRDDDGNPKDLVKVCDFGLAKLRDRDPEQDEDLTTVGMLMGSPAYMSPEQTRGETVDMRTDIYSLGVTLFECLSGKLPHDADTIEELFAQKMLHPPRALSTLVPGIDPDLSSWVNAALSTDPTKRPQSMRAFRDGLRKIALNLPMDDE